jgi:outer membrane protein OmpA-like peptidoglycan-associated protein
MYKNINKLLFSVIMTLVFVNPSFSQKGKEIKASKEYYNFAYIDAQEVYLDVVNKGYQSAQVYERIGNTYYFNSQYKEAAKWYKLLLDSYPDDVTSDDLFRLAQCYKSLNDYNASDQIMELYVQKGGDTKIAENYTGSNYLDQIAGGALKYELSVVSASTNNSDFGPSYYGEKVVFASASDTIIDKKLALHEWNNQPYLDLFVANVNDQGDLINVEPLAGDVNSKYHESSPVFSKDGKTMYFTRNNFLEGKKGKDKGTDGERRILLKIYKATLVGSKWTNITELPFNSDDFNTAHPMLSIDEKRMYFVSDRPESVGMSDIWYSDIGDNGSFGTPVNLESINTEARESFPFISKNNTLYFSSDGRMGLGGFDIYATELDANGIPTSVTNLGAPTNSEKDDFGFIFDHDKKKGYLSSNRSGEGGFVNDDIYLVVPCQVSITGVVTDAKTNELLPGARVQLFDVNNNAIGEPIIVGPQATYSFDADCSSSYRIQADKLDYKTEEVNVETPSTSGELAVPIALTPVDCPSYDLGCQLTLQPIYFDLDKYNIRKDAEVELAKILAAMLKYPELIIHIESHTDSRANDRYNEILSERRAQSTLNWLVQRGIDANRLTAKGYGETQLVNNCDNDTNCSEEKHQLNRRSMFIIQPIDK